MKNKRKIYIFNFSKIIALNDIQESSEEELVQHFKKIKKNFPKLGDLLRKIHGHDNDIVLLNRVVSPLEESSEEDDEFLRKQKKIVSLYLNELLGATRDFLLEDNVFFTSKSNKNLNISKIIESYNSLHLDDEIEGESYDRVVLVDYENEGLSAAKQLGCHTIPLEGNFLPPVEKDLKRVVKSNHDLHIESLYENHNKSWWQRLFQRHKGKITLGGIAIAIAIGVAIGLGLSFFFPFGILELIILGAVVGAALGGTGFGVLYCCSKCKSSNTTTEFTPLENNSYRSTLSQIAPKSVEATEKSPLIPDSPVMGHANGREESIQPVQNNYFAPKPLDFESGTKHEEKKTLSF